MFAFPLNCVLLSAKIIDNVYYNKQFDIVLSTHYYKNSPWTLRSRGFFFVYPQSFKTKVQPLIVGALTLQRWKVAGNNGADELLAGEIHGDYAGWSGVALQVVEQAGVGGGGVALNVC